MAVRGLFVTVCCLVLEVMHAKVFFFEPLSPDLVLTVDYRDQLFYKIADLFRNVTDQGLVPNYKLVSHEPSISVANMTAELIQEPVYDMKSSVTVNQTVFKLAGFSTLGEKNYGSFLKLCLFLWLGDEEPVFPEESKFCMEFNLRIVNMATDFRNLTESLYGKKLSLDVAPNTTGIQFSTVSQGLLPSYLNYYLSCPPIKGPDNKTLEVNFPKTVPNPDYLQIQDVNERDFTGFIGKMQTQLDGLVVDYDLDRMFFRVHTSTVNMPLVRSLRPTNKCLRATFYTAVTFRKNLIIVCEAAESTEFIQLSLIELVGYTNKLSKSDLVVISEMERSITPQVLQECIFTTVRLVLCKDGPRYFRTVNVTLDPISVQVGAQRNISQYEALYAERFGQNLNEFSLELLPAYDGGILYFSVKRPSEPERSIVTFSSYSILTTTKWNTSWITVKPWRNSQYIPADTVGMCISNLGVYLVNDKTKLLYLVQSNTQSLLVAKDLGRVSGTFKQMKCYGQQGYVMVDFSRTDTKYKRDKITTVFVGSDADITRDYREKGFFDYYYPTAKTGTPMWISYFDVNQKAVVIYTFYTLTVETANENSKKYRYTLFLDQQPVEFVSGEARNFKCRLNTWQMFDPSSSSTAGTDVKTANISLSVRKPPTFKIQRLNNTDTVQKVVRLSPNEVYSKFKVPLEDRFIIEGPIMNVGAKYGLKFDPEEAEINIIPRYELAGITAVDEKLANFSHILWIHRDLIVAVKDVDIFLLTRNTSNPSEFILNSTVDYYSRRTKYGNTFSGAKDFESIESIKFTFDDDDNRQKLVLTFFSEVVEQSWTADLGVGYIRVWVWIALDVKTLEYLSGASSPWTFNSMDMSNKRWVLLRSRAGPEPNFNSIRTVFMDQHTPNLENIGLVIRETMLKPNNLASAYKWIFGKILKNMSVTSLQQSDLLTMQTYWRPNSLDTSLGEDILQMVVSVKDNLFVHEYSILSNNTVTLVNDQIVSLKDVPGSVEAFNCSRYWQACVFGLDTNFLLQLNYTYSETTGIWQIDKPDPNFTGFDQFAGEGKMRSIDIGVNSLAVKTNQIGSDIHIYTRLESTGEIKLSYPYAVVNQPYRVPAVVIFANNCTVGEKGPCEQVEYFIQGQNSSSALIYSPSEIQLVLNMSRASMQRKINNTVSICFNDRSVLLGTRAREWKNFSTCEKLILDLDVSFTKRPEDIAIGSLALVVVICLLVVVAVLFGLNSLKYMLYKQDEASIQQELPLIDYAGRNSNTNPLPTK